MQRPTLCSTCIQLCERVYFDLLDRLELRLVPRAEVLEPGDSGSGRRWRERARPIEDFLQSPDRVQDLRSWLVAFVRDLLEIDAVAVYTHQTRGGKLHALEDAFAKLIPLGVVSPATAARLLHLPAPGSQ